MFGDGEPRVVMVDDHDIELPLARWMLMVHNDDRIGMVAAVATILADAGSTSSTSSWAGARRAARP